MSCEMLVCLNRMVLGRVRWFRMAALRELNPVPSRVDPALAVLRLTKSYVKRQKSFLPYVVSGKLRTVALLLLQCTRKAKKCYDC